MFRPLVAVMLLALVAKAVYIPQSRKLLDAKRDTLNFAAGHHHCIKCPPGTHQSQACETPGTKATCSPCTDGVDYTEYDNEMETCISCLRCKPGQEEASRCSTTRNTECRCKEGTFCPPEHPCEACVRCKTSCPDGQNFISACNATADAQCAKPTGPPTAADNQALIWCLTVVVLLVVIAIIVYYVCKKKLKSSIGGRSGSPCGSYTSAVQMLKRYHNNSRTQETRDNNINNFMDPAERPMLPHREGNEEVPSQVLGNNHLQGQGGDGQPMDNRQPNGANMDSCTLIPVDEDEARALKNSFHHFVEQVSDNWQCFMRKLGLTNNDMFFINADHKSEGTREVRIQMLYKWHSQTGNAGSVNTLLQALRDVNLGYISENITRQLLKDNLYKLLPAS